MRKKYTGEKAGRETDGTSEAYQSS